MTGQKRHLSAAGKLGRISTSTGPEARAGEEWREGEDGTCSCLRVETPEV